MGGMVPAAILGTGSSVNANGIAKSYVQLLRTGVLKLVVPAGLLTAGPYDPATPVLAESASWVPMMIATVGVLTAFLAATIAVAQNDIKKVLAYSTISQLGYTFLAARGYEVERGAGQSRFRLDLAVRAPGAAASRVPVICPKTRSRPKL